MEWTTFLDDLILDWTDKSGLSKSVAVFYKIRNIPYMLYPDLMNSWQGTLDMVKRNCGSCSPKHILMARIFKNLNLEARLVTFPFLWHEQAILYPDELNKLLPKLPISYHVACQIRRDDQWLNVDATFDPPLKKGGFVMNDWDGRNSTEVSLVCRGEIVHRVEEERIEYVAEMRKCIPEGQKEIEATFHQKLNGWFRRLRA
ncbi:MAG: hypothetical protein A2156_01430 [Deltaproteobacteria bacterium RBG_16_48_10]|nr:MAG: hypothetical protein A2156_01430 [Deltaproteobacteria bacterium RBG_16_48_10]